MKKIIFSINKLFFLNYQDILLQLIFTIKYDLQFIEQLILVEYGIFLYFNFL